MEVKCPSCPTGVPLKATISFDDAETNPNGVKLQSQHVNFIFRASDLKKYNVVVERGLTINWKNNIFELAYDKRELWEWNDPHHMDMILKTVYKKEFVC